MMVCISQYFSREARLFITETQCTYLYSVRLVLSYIRNGTMYGLRGIPRIYVFRGLVLLRKLESLLEKKKGFVLPYGTVHDACKVVPGTVHCTVLYIHTESTTIIYYYQSEVH